MADVRVRKLDDGVVQMLKDRALREHTSVEAILRVVITNEAKRPKQEMLERLMAHQATMQDKYGVMPDSTVEIREERDRWS